MSLALLSRKSEAGRTAKAEYDRLLHLWRRDIRGPLIVSLCLAALLAVPFWLFAPYGEFFAGVWIGSFMGMALWIRDDPPDRIGRWKRGAEGERMTWKALRPLEREGWRCFHDRDGGRGNLDHVLVGPSGVFLLDSKNLAGTLSLERAELTARFADAPRHDFTYSRLAGSVRGAARDLKKRLESDTGLRTWVQAVVVIWGDFPQGLSEQEKIVYVAGERLSNWLSAQPTRLSLRDQRLVQLALDAGLVAPPAVDVATA